MVKHTFIQKYLPRLIAKIASRYDEFVYVDLFAGPWKERTKDLSDTAFGIAMSAMRGAKARWKQNGRSVKMTAHLVDLNSDAIEKQKYLIAKYPDIEVHQYQGTAEAKLSSILSSIPTNAFCFGFIDPKGVPDIRKFQSLIERPNTEIFLNFMFEFANRFASTERMPTLEWLTEVNERDAFREEISELSGNEREVALTDRARFALARMGDFRFAPAITVDEEDADRCLYKLILLSRHEMGLQVFRDAQRAALEIQAMNRSDRKSVKRATQSGMEDMFVDIEPINPAERSAKEIQNGVNDGKRCAFEIIREAGTQGISWGALWPKVLEENVLTHSDLGDIVVSMRDSGQISIRGWEPRVRKPRDGYQLIDCSKKS
nr:three-Cys-motif partner protein TcmP [Sphingopyxis sp. BSNA05]